MQAAEARSPALHRGDRRQEAPIGWQVVCGADYPLAPDRSRGAEADGHLRNTSHTVDVAADTGRQVSFDGPRHYFLPVRRISMKRASSNVIQNALAKFGPEIWPLSASNRDPSSIVSLAFK